MPVYLGHRNSEWRELAALVVVVHESRVSTNIHVSAFSKDYNLYHESVSKQMCIMWLPVAQFCLRFKKNSAGDFKK